MEYEKNIKKVFCPLADEAVEVINCIENRDIIDGFFDISCLPEKYTAKADFKEICKSCKWHNID